MSRSLRALLAGIVDYAGLFPPARLPLDEALRNYARYRSEPDAWMLGRFVCPAARLAELSPLVDELFGSGPPLSVSALGRGGDTVAAFLEGLRADQEAVDTFRRRHGDRATVDMLELRLPPDVLAPARPDPLSPLLRSTEEIVFAARLCPPPITWESRGIYLYFEGPLGANWRHTLILPPMLCGGYKLRTGGLEASAFPTPEQVVATLIACGRAKRPFKATAGLHHPIRHFDAQLQASVHGFLNVFGAGVLLAALGLTERRVRRIIEDEDPAHFSFTDEGFRWKDLSAPVDAIVRARRERVVSFGSCSFDEPRADLRALGLLG